MISYALLLEIKFLITILIIKLGNTYQIVCFNNFSDQKHKIIYQSDSLHYACSRSVNEPKAERYWKKYNVYGVSQSVATNGDVNLAIAMSF